MLPCNNRNNVQNKSLQDGSDPSALCRGAVRPVGTYFPDNDHYSIHYTLLIACGVTDLNTWTSESLKKIFVKICM